MDQGIAGIIGVVIGGLLTMLSNSILERSKLKQVQAERDRLDAGFEQLRQDHRDLLDEKLSSIQSRRRISFQLLVLDGCIIEDRINNRPPALEILGINALGPVHQGRELLRDIVRSREMGGYGGRVRILLLDPRSDAYAGPKGRREFEEDKVGRLAAELTATFYILSDIRQQVGDEAFANLEVRLYHDDPDRSLIMIDVGATSDRGDAADIILANPNGVILENLYHRRPGRRGLEGESRRLTSKEGGGVNDYEDNLKHFRNLWSNARPVPVPREPFALDPAVS